LGIQQSPVSRGNFEDWRQRAQSFELIAAFAAARERVVRFGNDDPEIVHRASVVASALPAHRASAADPVSALRAE
jgi:hypothetical protein